MALSNRDRIDRGFIALATGLDEFLDRVLGPDLGGASWIELMEAVDHKRGHSRPADHSAADPQTALRFITEKYTSKFKPGWYPLGDVLSRSQESWASELRDTRNVWAHHAAKGFSDDDAYRALDTMERLLRACGQPKQADDIAEHRKQVNRQMSARQDRAVIKSAVSTANVGSGTLPAWRDVLQPHPDVATGRFQAAEFAADLHNVARGERDGENPEYADPIAFFERTYLTEGLRDLLVRAARRLSGDAGASPVVNLQTTFGGGKTHSMLAVWHLASGRSLTDYPQDLQELLGDEPIPADVRRVALVGNHLQAGAPNHMPDGTMVNTLWGALAWQLGGAEGYAMVAESDKTRTNPGDALRQLFERFGPAVILIDEWVAYARELYGRDDLAGGTFDTQFTFAQTLTEAAKAVPGVLVLISIPASAEMADGEYVSHEEEVGGNNGKQALLRLQKVVARVADQWQAANADESFEIVRRRIFITPDAEAMGRIRGVAKALVEFYRKEQGYFPRETQQPDYERRLQDYYPIHPELFDRLYRDWSTLPRFQRTRGVLRLMNVIVHALWESEDAAPLIMPGSVPLADERVASELTQYLDDAWKAIIATDVDGPTSEPMKIDGENPMFKARHTTRRLARTVFLGATPTLRSADKGIDRSRVFLGTAIPEDRPGNFHSALDTLANRATYFYTGGQAYWFDTHANTTRAAADYAEGLDVEDVWAEIVKRLRTHQTVSADGFSGVHIAPDSSSDVPDQDSVRLVIIPPRHTQTGKSGGMATDFANEVLSKRGSASRAYRNTLLFLAADSKREEELEASVRQYLAWQHIYAGADTAYDLTASQKEQARERAAQQDRTVTDRLLSAYIWLIRPVQFEADKPFQVEAEKADGSGTDLALRAAERARRESDLSTGYSHSRIMVELTGPLASVWGRDRHISVGQLWELYCKYPYMARLRDRSVLENALVQAPDDLLTGLALADSHDGERYVGLVLPQDGARPASLPDSALVVDPKLARAQQDEEDEVTRQRSSAAGHPEASPTAPNAGVSASGAGVDRHSSGSPVSTVESAIPSAPKAVRYFGTVDLRTDRPSAQFADIASELIQHLSNHDGATVRPTLEVEANAPEGFDEGVVRLVRENGSTLGFENNAFDEG